MKGVAHYKKDGTPHTEGTHKMPNGELHSGKEHSSSSEKVFHFAELSAAAKKVAKNQTKTMPNKPAKKKTAKKKTVKKKAKSFTEAVESRMSGY